MSRTTFFSPRRAGTRLQPAERQCSDCGAELHGEYCSACGQRDEPIRQPIGHFVRASVEDNWSLDGRVWRSLGLLLARPGALTAAYVDGKRTRYVRPLRLYLLATILFFFLMSVVDPVTRFTTGLEAGTDDSTVTALMEATDAREILGRLAARTQDLGGRHDLESARDAVDRERDRLLNRVTAGSGAPEADSMLRALDATRGSNGRLELMSGLPEWMHGPTIRRFEDARTNAQRREALQVLGRELIGRVPTAMFVLLPLYAGLLKALYLRGGGTRRKRPRRRRRLRRARRPWRRAARAVWGAMPRRLRVARRMRLRHALIGRRPRFFTEHLVFSLHVHAFAFLAFSVLVVLLGYGAGRGVEVSSQAIAAGVPLYFLLAQKRVYAQRWGKTLVKAAVLGLSYAILLAGTMALAALMAAALG